MILISIYFLRFYFFSYSVVLVSIEKIYQTLETVIYRISSKILRCASYFQLSSQCLETWWNTVSRVWYITSKTAANLKFTPPGLPFPSTETLFTSRKLDNGPIDQDSQPIKIYLSPKSVYTNFYYNMKHSCISNGSKMRKMKSPLSPVAIPFLSTHVWYHFWTNQLLAFSRGFQWSARGVLCFWRKRKILKSCSYL